MNNKKKYFCVSDIHSFYEEFKESLDQSGFDIVNPNHILLVLGDIFDRGPDTVKVYNYIRSLPKSRRILIRGNHESLFLDLLNKRFPDRYDFSNGTVQTFCHLAGYDPACLDVIRFRYSIWNDLDEELTPEEYWRAITDIVKNHPVTQWLQGDEWINYYEVDNYIFVHSFIPLNDSTNVPSYILEAHAYSYNASWRDASNYEWEQATWGCPWKLIQQNLNLTGKTIVSGHWHSHDFFVHLLNWSEKESPWGIFCSRSIIAIDGCTAHTKHVNVLVIDGDTCYDQTGHKLEYYD